MGGGGGLKSKINVPLYMCIYLANNLASMPVTSVPTIMAVISSQNNDTPVHV